MVSESPDLLQIRDHNRFSKREGGLSALTTRILGNARVGSTRTGGIEIANFPRAQRFAIVKMQTHPFHSL